MAHTSGTININGKDYTYSPVLAEDDGNCIYSDQAPQWGNYAWQVYLGSITWAYSTSWYTPDAKMPAYIGYDYKENVVKTGVVLYVDDYNIPHHHPADFDIEAAKDNTWAITKTVTGVNWQSRTPLLFSFGRPVKAKKFRINITRFAGSNYSGVLHRVRFIDSETINNYLYLKNNAVYGMKAVE